MIATSNAVVGILAQITASQHVAEAKLGRLPSDTHAQALVLALAFQLAGKNGRVNSGGIVRALRGFAIAKATIYRTLRELADRGELELPAGGLRRGRRNWITVSRARFSERWEDPNAQRCHYLLADARERGLRTPAELGVMAYFAGWGKGSVCHQSNGRIATFFGCAIRTLTGIVQKLVRGGVLQNIRRGLSDTWIRIVRLSSTPKAPSVPPKGNESSSTTLRPQRCEGTQQSVPPNQQQYQNAGARDPIAPQTKKPNPFREALERGGLAAAPW